MSTGREPDATRPSSPLQTVVVQCQEDYETIGSFTDGTNNAINVQLKKLHYTKIDRAYQPGQGPVPRDEVRRSASSVADLLSLLTLCYLPHFNSFETPASTGTPSTSLRLPILSKLSSRSTAIFIVRSVRCPFHSDERAFHVVVSSIELNFLSVSSYTGRRSKKDRRRRDQLGGRQQDRPSKLRRRRHQVRHFGLEIRSAG